MCGELHKDQARPAVDINIDHVQEAELWAVKDKKMVRFCEFPRLVQTLSLRLKNALSVVDASQWR